MSLYKAFLIGRAPAHNTRIALTSIRAGFWSTKGNAFELVIDDVPQDNVEYVMDMVRLGDRPALHVYESPNKADQFRFVCPDDVALHAAYSILGVTAVPAVLFGKPRGLIESCISTRSLKAGSQERISLCESISPATRTMVPTFFGSDPPAAGEALSVLIAAVRGAKEKVKRFHRGGAVTLHYHHSIYSVLLRAEQTLRSIKLLCEAGLYLNAATLVRPLYELLLTFYVDWLAPTHMHRYMQIAALCKESHWKSQCDSDRVHYIKEGATPTEAKLIRDAHVFSFQLCSVVSEKARLFPLGEKHHRDLYSFLSDLLHHDYSIDARYTHTLEHGDEAVFDEDAVTTIVRWADIFTAELVSQVESDIGLEATETPLSNGGNVRPPNLRE